MPQKAKFKKDNTQPSVAPMLNLTPSAKSAQSAETNNTDNELKPQKKKSNKKRRRATGDSTGNSPQNITNPNRSERKKAKTMETPNIQEGRDNTLSVEMQEMEKRITASITNHNQESMKNLIQVTMQEMLKPIQDSIDNLLVMKTNLESQEGKINRLKNENSKLSSEIHHLKCEMTEVQKKLIQLEDKSLERNLIFHGISELTPDEENDRAEKIYQAISATISRDTIEERIQLAREVELIRTRRLGKPDPSRARALSVEFSNKFDAEQIYANRFNMADGIYVDREFSYTTERDRRLLRPFLKAAKNIPGLKKKCRLEGNKLVIDSKRYTKENLHELPKTLDPMKVTTKSNDQTLGFFGELCPLSNFHRSSFLYNEVEYHSSEQMIQHMKAKLFGDKAAQTLILNAKTPLDCKKISKDIDNFNFKTWAGKAKDLCTKGLEAKFAQNPKAMQCLLETGHKSLVECTYDGLWGNGIPLHQPHCLNRQQWKRQGILGELLQDIRAKHLEIARSLLPANPWFHRGPPNAHMSPVNQSISTPDRGSNTASNNIDGIANTLNPSTSISTPQAPNYDTAGHAPLSNTSEQAPNIADDATIPSSTMETS